MLKSNRLCRDAISRVSLTVKLQMKQIRRKILRLYKKRIFQSYTNKTPRLHFCKQGVYMFLTLEDNTSLKREVLF